LKKKLNFTNKKNKNNMTNEEGVSLHEKKEDRILGVNV
jgi:hypothetical protein